MCLLQCSTKSSTHLNSRQQFTCAESFSLLRIVKLIWWQLNCTSCVYTSCNQTLTFLSIFGWAWSLTKLRICREWKLVSPVWADSTHPQAPPSFCSITSHKKCKAPGNHTTGSSINTLVWQWWRPITSPIPSPTCASQWETVWWTKLNFWGLLPKSGKNLWKCNYYMELPLQQ